MKKLTLYTLLAIIVSISTLKPAFAQSGKEGGRISGTVSDENKKILESASVSLLRAKDSSLVRELAVGQSGKFEFEKIKDGSYLVSATAIGHLTYYSASIEISSSHPVVDLQTIQLTNKSTELKEVSVTGKKSFIEQKPDRMVVNVDASPTSAGSTVMDILEKSPGVTIDKDGNISLKGKQGVLIMIDNKPTYLNSTQLANYLKSLPASAIEQLEIMTNPSAKYDAAGNSGIINIKTKKNKSKGLNGSVTTTYTQGIYPKPGVSANMNYRNGKFNVFFNGGYSHWEGFQELDINRNYLNASDHKINSIFTQNSVMKFTNPELNAKLGVDYYLNNKTTIGFVASGFSNNETDHSTSTIYLKSPDQSVDSIVYSPSVTKSKWRNGSFNLNFRHQFDSNGTELTADADYVRYTSGGDQYFDNITYDPNWNKINEKILTGNLPSQIDIYSLKSDFTHSFNHAFKLEGGIKSSYVSTDNQANYFNVINGEPIVDTSKTNHFLYRENINAVYVNLSKQIKKWNIQAGLRMENTNYSGHQLGNDYTVNNNDSMFSKSYVNLFPTLYVSYQVNEKNQFAINYGRRIDRPAYQDLNPFLFFLDEYTYQAGNPYLQPQYTDNIEFSHTYKSWLTTTLNYSNTKNYFSETFEQDGHATIVRNGNIGKRQNAGAAVSAQIPVKKWWTAIVYANVNYNKFEGLLYGENINVSATTFLVNVNNQFRFGNGWSGELSGFYRTKGVDGQLLIDPLGQVSAAISKQLMKDKANLKVGIRDMFYTQKAKGAINFQETQVTFSNVRDSRQLSISFTYRFGKPIKGSQPARHSSGASDESNRVKSGGNN